MARTLWLQSLWPIYYTYAYYATISYKTRYVLSTIDATAYQTADDTHSEVAQTTMRYTLPSLAMCIT